MITIAATVVCDITQEEAACVLAIDLRATGSRDYVPEGFTAAAGLQSVQLPKDWSFVAMPDGRLLTVSPDGAAKAAAQAQAQQALLDAQQKRGEAAAREQVAQAEADADLAEKRERERKALAGELLDQDLLEEDRGENGGK